jgi:hypothetical protein
MPGAVAALTAVDNRLIAVGTAGSSASGVRVAVYDLDVREASAPRLRGRATFGSDWTWSIAEDDDRAISFEPRASLVALPFTASSVAGRYEMGAQVVDLAGGRPNVSAVYPSPAWIDRIVFVGDRVVAVGHDGVHVVDYAGAAPGLEMR